MTGITEQVRHLRARIAVAAAGAGRRAEDIRLLAVSKGHPPEAVRAARDAGLTDFGENYLNEALPKIAACDRDLSWHFIGRIQSNKTRLIAENFAWAGSVADVRIAERLSAQRPYYGGDLNVLIQVQPAGAAHRDGCPSAGLAALAAAIDGLPRLKLRGLLVIPLAGLGEEALRGEFRRVRGLFDELRRNGHDVDTLSMGMSGDFETAIAEGSTLVRIGTSLFGPRPATPGKGEG